MLILYEKETLNIVFSNKEGKLPDDAEMEIIKKLYGENKEFESITLEYIPNPDMNTSFSIVDGTGEIQVEIFEVPKPIEVETPTQEERLKAVEDYINLQILGGMGL